MLAYICNIKERHPFVPQFVRFFCVGFLNTIIDFSMLNLLILLSGKSDGFYYAIFKSASFILAVTNSYFMNKQWTFKSSEITNSNELLRFLGVNIIGLLINVGIASYVVNFIGAPAGFSPVLWANIGACSSVVITLTWNFIGMKTIVFKK